MSKIVIYSTGFCGFCHSAKAFFKAQNLDYDEIHIDKERGMREQMVKRSGRTSVPQIFVGEHHVGGYEEMIAMHRKGEFLPLVTE